MAKPSNTYDAIILGAGGAGLMCAATAGQRGRRVLVIDHADQPGKKILISGGGRCNFTNIHTGSNRYLSDNPHFAKSALSRFTPDDFIALVEDYAIAWHEKTLGQLFCDGSARQVVALLRGECAKGAVTLTLGQSIEDVDHADGQYRVKISGRNVTAPALVIATGGPSIPKMGATGFAYDLARRFGLKVIEPRPALVPLTLGPNEQHFKSLAGVSAPVRVHCGKTNFQEALLFTHKGLSGPAILQISSYWRLGDTIAINFFPALKPDWLVNSKRDAPCQTFDSALGSRLPHRLAAVLAQRLGHSDQLANLSDRLLMDAHGKLSDWRFTPMGSEGFAKAEVTAGGIETGCLSSQTMEAKQMRGLYVIGEAVDVTGWLGGYNFQWAWASGWAAGQAL